MKIIFYILMTVSIPVIAQETYPYRYAHGNGSFDLTLNGFSPPEEAIRVELLEYDPEYYYRDNTPVLGIPYEKFYCNGNIINVCDIPAGKYRVRIVWHVPLDDINLGKETIERRNYCFRCGKTAIVGVINDSKYICI